MKKLIMFLLIGVLAAQCAAVSAEDKTEEGIQIENVQAVSVGDDAGSESTTSDGEDADGYTEDTAAGSEQEATEEIETVQLEFEEGFTISFPADWKYYELTDEMRISGVLYALGDPEGKRSAYIQSWDTDCADIDALNTIIQNTESPASSGIHEFGGIPFVVYDLPGDDVSCAAALINGKAVNIVFSPQSDSEFMITAAKIMQSFTLK